MSRVYNACTCGGIVIKLSFVLIRYEATACRGDTAGEKAAVDTCHSACEDDIEDR